MSLTMAEDTESNNYRRNNYSFEIAIDPFEQIASSEREAGREAGLRAGYLEGENIGRTKGWEIGLELGYIYEFSKEILEGCHKQQRQLSSAESFSPSSAQQQLLGQQSYHNHVHNVEHEEANQSRTENRMNYKLHRCLDVAKDLVQMIDEFPDPDSLLSQNANDSDNSEITDENEMVENKLSASDINYSERQFSAETNDRSILQLPQDEDDSEGNIQKNESKMKAMLDVSSSIQRIRAKFKLLGVLLRTQQPFDLKRVLEAKHNMGAALEINSDHNIHHDFGNNDNERGLKNLSNKDDWPGGSKPKKYSNKIREEEVTNSNIGNSSDW